MSDTLGAIETAAAGAIAPYAIWLKLAAALVGIVLVAAGAWWITSNYYALKISDMEKLQAQAIVIAQDRAAHQQEAADGITAKLNSDALEARNRQLQITIANLQKVADYVTPETDARFPLPCGFVRLHNAAASGTAAAAVPLPAGATDGGQCDVKASAAIGIIQGNYDLALAWKAERDSWWRWYDQQKANWDAYRASAAKEN